MTQAQFGKESGLTQAEISHYELGRVAPSEEALRRMAKVARIDWTLTLNLRQFFTSFLASATSGGASAMSTELDLKILEPVVLAVTPLSR